MCKQQQKPVEVINYFTSTGLFFASIQLDISSIHNVRLLSIALHTRVHGFVGASSPFQYEAVTPPSMKKSLPVIKADCVDSSTALTPPHRLGHHP